jgi:hypothetical protein
MIHGGVFVGSGIACGWSYDRLNGMKSSVVIPTVLIAMAIGVVTLSALRHDGDSQDGPVGDRDLWQRLEALEQEQAQLQSSITDLAAAVEEQDRALFARPEADRRPVGWLPTHGAPASMENPDGLRSQFHDPQAGYEWLLRELTTRPFTRFIVHQPAGWQMTPARGTRMGGAQYWPIDDQHLAMWKAAIRAAMRARPEITIGIYGSIKGQYTHSTDMTDWRVFDFSSARDRWFVWHQVVKPWVDAGVYEYWFDNASPPDERRRNGLLFASWLMRARYVHAGIEAIPNDAVGGNRELDDDALETAPCLALLRYVRKTDPERRWNVRNRPYEVIVLIHPRPDEPEITIEELVDLLERGFVLGSSGVRGSDQLVLEAYRRWASATTQ